MEKLFAASTLADDLVAQFKELTKSGEFNGERLVFGCSAVSNLQLVNRTKQFGGLDIVENPLLFSGKLAYACSRRYEHEVWADQFKQSKNETVLRGMDDYDFSQGTGPYGPKETHWTIRNIYIAHEVRAHFGLSVPSRVQLQRLDWLERILAKELSKESLDNMERRAGEITDRAARNGKIDAYNDRVVEKYMQTTFDNMKVEREATRRIARQNLLLIGNLMCFEEYARMPADMTEEELKKGLERPVSEYLAQLVGFLENTRERMEKLEHSFKYGREASETIKIIDAVLEYGYTDEYAAELKKRENAAKAITSRFKVKR